MMEKIVNQACLRNQQPIYQTLQPWLSAGGQLLELASGTGQHGVYIAQRLPNISWQLTEHPENLELSKPWFEEAQLPNLKAATPVDIRQPLWSFDNPSFDFAYCANLLHFISKEALESVFMGITSTLKQGGVFFCYGPINENGFTSEGNRTLDAWLKADVNPQAGIKELRQIKHVAQTAGMEFKSREDLPANNVILIFEKE